MIRQYLEDVRKTLEDVYGDGFRFALREEESPSIYTGGVEVTLGLDDRQDSSVEHDGYQNRHRVYFLADVFYSAYQDQQQSWEFVDFCYGLATILNWAQWPRSVNIDREGSVSIDFEDDGAARGEVRWMAEIYATADTTWAGVDVGPSHPAHELTTEERQQLSPFLPVEVLGFAETVSFEVDADG